MASSPRRLQVTVVSVKRVSHKLFDQYRRHRGVSVPLEIDNFPVNRKLRVSSSTTDATPSASREGSIAMPFAWLALQIFLGSLQRETGLSEISPKSQRLLEWIYAREKMGDSRGLPLPLQFIAEASTIGSMATMYHLLFELASTGFIDICEDPLDTRRKLIRTTPKTQSLLTTLAKSAESWAALLRELPKRIAPESRSSSQ